MASVTYLWNNDVNNFNDWTVFIILYSFYVRRVYTIHRRLKTDRLTIQVFT